MQHCLANKSALIPKAKFKLPFPQEGQKAGPGSCGYIYGDIYAQSMLMSFDLRESQLSSHFVFQAHFNCSSVHAGKMSLRIYHRHRQQSAKKSAHQRLTNENEWVENRYGQHF